MNTLLRSLGIFITLGVFAALVAGKVADIFPQMDTTAWIVMLGGYTVQVFVALKLNNLVEEIWPERFNESQRQWLAVAAAFIAGAAVLYLGWSLWGEWIAPHFGPAVL